MLLEVLKKKLADLKAQKESLKITEEQKAEVDKKVEEYRKQLLAELEEQNKADSFRLDNQISLLEELIEEDEKQPEPVVEAVAVEEQPEIQVRPITDPTLL